MKIWLILGFLLLASCQTPEAQKAPWKEIEGRGIAGAREPLYRGRIPENWKIIPVPLDNENTMLPIAEYQIDDVISVTVHNFPQSIPPNAQIERWKRQFQSFTPHTSLTKPQAHGGFVGLRFEAEGTLKEKPTMILAWAMHIPSSSDYTIKVTGPPEDVRKHRQDIETFARSFELIEEIPHDN